ncbi:MAG: hypothetical protein HY321_05345 [Armatimonadetes bacterium]|nr:hypothetical protein [Armatimonadota bacterium]
MKRIFLTAVLLIVGSARICTADVIHAPYDPQTMQFPVSPEQAFAIARAWTGDPMPDLELEYVWWVEDILWSETYRLREPGSQVVNVDCYTGWVQRWTSIPLESAYCAHASWNQNPRPPELPLAQLQAAATAFARARYPGFDALNMGLMDLRVQTSLAWSFATVLPTGGFFLGNQCAVATDPFAGDVWSFVAWGPGEAVTVPLTPTVSAAAAETIALDSYAGEPGIPVALIVAPSRLNVTIDGLGEQRLVWLVETATSEDPNYTLEEWVANEGDGSSDWSVWVDAFTGEILYHQGYLGSGGKRPAPEGWQPRLVRLTRKPEQRRGPTGAELLEPRHIKVLVEGRQPAGRSGYPPIRRDGAVYWYAGYARSRLWKMTWAREGKELTLKRPDGRRFVLRDGSRTLRVDGTPEAIPDAPVVVRGRTYLPLSLWERITGDEFRWDEKANAVRISLRGRARADGARKPPGGSVRGAEGDPGAD